MECISSILIGLVARTKLKILIFFLHIGPDSKDQMHWGLYKKKNNTGLMFTQYRPKQAWLIRDLLYDWKGVE